MWLQPRKENLEMSYGIKLTSASLALMYTLSGCVSTKTVAVGQNVLNGFRGATIVASQRGKPTFVAHTARKIMFGLVGAAAAISSGKDIIRDNDVPDPAVYISQALLTDLVRDEGLTSVKDTAATNTMDVAQLAKQYSGADLLIDVQTINWSFVYFPTNWSHYRVIYSAKLRLIDTKHAKLIADSFCARVPEETPDAPTREELLDNHAAGLKKQLAVAADFCVQEFRAKALQDSKVAGL
jgi:hypothetical protein